VEIPIRAKKLYLLYNADTRHYNVISNIKAVMAKKYMCNTCDTLYNIQMWQSLLPMYSYATLY